ncbi:MAG: acetyl-CoA acetyltransferase [Sneathiella sp.]
MVHDRMPVLIGVGQSTERGVDLKSAASPLDLMERAVHAATLDAGISNSALENLDVIAVVKSLIPFTKNPAYSLEQRLGVAKAFLYETPIGGNMPQFLMNKYCEEIAIGKIKFALFAGAEAMDTGRRLLKSGVKPDWNEPAPAKANQIVDDIPMATEHEKAHGIWPARNVYPLFENALRASYGNSIDKHQLEIGTLFSRFSDVASENDFAWFPIKRSPEEIAHVSDKNRLVGWPYTKYMNAMNQVNQSAALLLTSVGAAREMGVPEDKWVFLHGCADANEKWHVHERVNYHSSPAIERVGHRTLSMAGKSVDDMTYMDIYSCFPVAVEIARDELGISRNDDRDLTVTGGLPYFGGAGSYVMNAIVEMAQRLRSDPGEYGLITANGGYLSEHSMGIYSTDAPTQATDDVPWIRTNPAIDQKIIDALQAPEFIEDPEGPAIIETYTVASGRDGVANLGIVIGRLGDGSDPMAPRFIANTPTDLNLANKMMTEDYIGAAGYVTKDETINRFIPD